MVGVLVVVLVAVVGFEWGPWSLDSRLCTADTTSETTDKKTSESDKIDLLTQKKSRKVFGVESLWFLGPRLTTSENFHVHHDAAVGHG